MKRVTSTVVVNGWTRIRDHTKQEEATYGVYVFLLLHHKGTEREAMKIEALGRLIPGALVGRMVKYLPEARRTYLALCARFNVTPEAEV